jgi:hypothetical protein
MRGDAQALVVDNPGGAYMRATMQGMDVREAGRLGANATNSKLSKKRRQENARKAAKARWSKKG